MKFFGSFLEEEKRKGIGESAPTRENKCSKASMQTFLGQCKARTVRIPNSFKLNCGLSTSPTSSGTANQIYRTDQIPMAMEPESSSQNSRLFGSSEERESTGFDLPKESSSESWTITGMGREQWRHSIEGRNRGRPLPRKLWIFILLCWPDGILIRVRLNLHCHLNLIPKVYVLPQIGSCKIHFGSKIDLNSKLRFYPIFVE